MERTSTAAPVGGGKAFVRVIFDKERINCTENERQGETDM